jgi:predicted HTH transcriptional regulator
MIFGEMGEYKFFMPKPFREIDPHTLARHDTPPGFRVFREAAVNLLIHQDYGDSSRKATIKFFQDGIQFWNPGDVFGDDSRLLEPGEKEVRNPAITAAMRRIVLCEQAGTGLRMMQREWQELGHSAPVLRNDRSWKAFEFFIPGLDNEYDSASTLMKAMFRNKETPVPPVTEQVEAQDGAQEAQGEAQDGAQEAQGEAQDVLLTLNPFDIAILEACKEAPKTGQELLDIAGYSTRTGNFKRSLNRLLISRLICMTIPGKPRSSKQKYRLTETGHHLLNSLHGDGKP